MRILVLSNIGLGLYKFRKELLEELVKNDEVYFCIPEDDFVEPIKDIGCRYINNPVLDRRGKNPIKDIELFYFYKRILHTIKPNVVLTYTIKPNVYGGMACASAGIPYIVNVTGLGTAIENGGILRVLGLGLYKLGLRKAQKVFFQNSENKDFMLNHKVLRGEYELIPGSGVNLEQYKPISYPDGDTVDFAFIARVMKEKGIDQYLDAAKSIRKKHPETRFHVYGFCEQDYENQLRSLTDDGVIIFHGLVADMSTVYQSISCTIHPTYYPEGISNVLLESAASGRPIITTNRSGCREVVKNGVNGYLVKAKDSGDLVDIIERFLRLSIEERKMMGLAGRKIVEESFDRRIVIEMYMDEINNIRSNNQEVNHDQRARQV